MTLTVGRGAGLGEVGAVGAATSGVTAASLAAVSAACCTGPLLAPMVVAVLGAGGAAWAAGLKPYAPYFFAASAVLLGFGFRSVYRRRSTVCAVAVSPMRRALGWVTRGTLWLSAAIWIASVALAVYATYFDNPYS